MIQQWNWKVLVFLLVFVLSYASCKKHQEDGSFNVDLEASWEKIPFELNLLESIAGHNESLYQNAAAKVAGIDVGVFDGSDDIEESDGMDDDLDIDDPQSHSDLSTYNSIIGNLGLDEISKSLIDFHLVNKLYSPRVQAQFHHYKHVIKPAYQSRLVKQCSTDSFGNEVAGMKDGDAHAWVLFNDKIYCSPDELYALQTDSKISDVELLPFDRVIGTNQDSPLLILYGDVRSPEFAQMFENLYSSSQSGKLRFVWRYIPTFQTAPETLGAYGVALSLKKTDYLAIDDRDIDSNRKDQSSGQKASKSRKLKLSQDLSKISQLRDDLHAVTKTQLKDLGLKITAFIQSNTYKNISKFELIRTLLNDFPKYAYYIANLTGQKNLKAVEEVVEQNVKIGASEDSNGIYVNGAAIPAETFDLHSLFDKIKSELSIINELKSFGFTTPQAKKLVTKFALLSAVKESQFKKGNTLMGENENRFKLFEHAFVPKQKDRGGVVFVNNIEEEDVYSLYTNDRKEAYIGPGSYQMPFGQVPPLKENVHDLIFVINFGHKKQLEVFFTVAKFFLDRGIPKQIGLLPLVGNDPRDEQLAQLFYFLADNGSPKECLALLYQYFETTNVDEEEKLFESIPMPHDHAQSYAEYRHTLKKFSIDSPSVIFNGVINDLKGSTWQKDMRAQVAQDVRLLQHHIRSGTDEGKKLKDILYENAKMERNLRVIPKDPAAILYKKVSPAMYKKSVGFKRKKAGNVDEISGTFWLIGDFNSDKLLDQFIILAKVIAKNTSPNSMQIRVINTSSDNKLLIDLQQQFGDSINFKALVDYISEHRPSEASGTAKRSPEVLKLLEENGLQSHQPSLLFNSRYFRLTDIFKVKELNLLIEYEFKQRLSIIKDLVLAYPEDFSSQTLFQFNDRQQDDLEWFDLLSSVVTKSFYVDDVSLFLDDVARFDFNSLNMANSIDVTGDYNTNHPIDILAIIDPVDEYSQKLVNMINSIADLSFVNVKILLQPSLEEQQDLKIKQFYRGVYPSSLPQFEKSGQFVDNWKANFSDLPSNQLLTTNIDSPQKWIVTTKKVSSPNVDLYNLQMSNYNSLKPTSATFELKSILVEGYANDVRLGLPSAGLELQFVNPTNKIDTSVMGTLGYFQLQADAGVWDLSIKQNTKSEQHCSLLSGSSNPYAANDDPLDSVAVPVFKLSGSTLSVRITKNPGFESKNLLIDIGSSNDEGDSVPNPSDSKLNKMWGSLTRSKQDNDKSQNNADINVFSIASGHLYERLIGIMMASVRRHTDHTIKFWIIENYISPQFKQLLPLLSEQYKFEYQLITYKWPSWLRKQRDSQRTIWAYKILFLDVIFPQDLKKVIFVDADSIVRTDLQDLVDLDLEGAPYGFTPMCDSRKEMEGYRFWEQGYWPQVLGDTFKYHISALFVVDLNKFRSISAGDRLRNHYHSISADPASLSNLDQDLPNNMQKWIKIKSLPQEWLWCETWCSEKTFSDARVVDLCNNPLTKENKVDSAKRHIPEWRGYDQEIDRLQKKLQDSSSSEEAFTHDEL